jgi:2-polyprenyl-3-methyl-5-hydroxy-6-metoxy-1,4-benzoquinol methylase
VDSSRYTNTVREDFDRLADLSEGDSWDHNAHYHSYLLKHLPAHLAETLEVGCGTGTFTRMLAECSERVIAVDLSARIVEVAPAVKKLVGAKLRRRLLLGREMFA